MRYTVYVRYMHFNSCDNHWFWKILLFQPPALSVCVPERCTVTTIRDSVCVPTCAPCMKKATAHSRIFPGCFFFICSSLHFRKRIRGFCLLCVSVWPLRGPWCQLRWSAQCICGDKSQHVSQECSVIMAECSRLQLGHVTFFFNQVILMLIKNWQTMQLKMKHVASEPIKSIS